MDSYQQFMHVRRNGSRQVERIRNARQSAKQTRAAALAVVVCVAATAGCHRGSGVESRAERAAAADDQLVLVPLDSSTSPHPHNVLKITDRVYSGGEPADEAAFARLRRMGIRTIVSVDGAKPRIELARKYGMRYVHIPIGYDAVPDAAGRSLARLVDQAEAPFYIHCHHGKHRGPAAAAVACAADGVVQGDAALEILRAAGTSPDYTGLWRDVRDYRPPAEDEPLPGLVEVAEVESMAAAMAAIDRASDNLRLCQSVGWRTPRNHPDLQPDHEALLLKEQFREVVRRLESSNAYDEEFLQWMRDTTADLELLETAIRSGDRGGASDLFQAIQTQCATCHRQYRN